jgi:heparin binding hemagglutinin HbhA
MSEPQTPQNQNPEDDRRDLSIELRELGQQLEQAVRSMLASDQAHRLQRDISNGMQEIGSQLKLAMNSIRENPQIQNLAERGQQTVNQVSENQAMKDFQESLTRGVSQLNEQLAAFIARNRGEEAGSTPPPQGAQNVQIENDDPATGPTTRLNEDR